MQTRRPDPLLSFVVPVLDEALCVEEFARRARKAAEAAGVRCEIIFVDDGSSDATPEKLEALHRADPSIKSVRLTRCFGHQAALCAGLRFASGDVVVTLDGDLQHPPETVGELLEAWREGADVVHTIRSDEPGHARSLKARTSTWFYRLMGLASRLTLATESADFRLMDRRVVDAFNEMGEYFVFARGMVPWMGFRDAHVRYRVGERYAGRTKYGPGQMIGLATDGIFSFSVVPLRMISWIGLSTTLFGVGFGVFSLVSYFAGTVQSVGWTSTVCLVLIFGGVQLLSLGIVSEYIGRIYEEVKGRPRYVVDRLVGLETSGAEATRSVGLVSAAGAPTRKAR